MLAKYASKYKWIPQMILKYITANNIYNYAYYYVWETLVFHMDVTSLEILMWFSRKNQHFCGITKKMNI